MTIKEKLLTSFEYSEPENPPTLHPMSLERLVLACITTVSDEEKNVSLLPGNILQPWVLKQLTDVVEEHYGNIN